MLPANDVAFLQSYCPAHSVTSEAGAICVVLPEFLLGGGFAIAQADLLLRLQMGYPDTPPDMWWFSPAVRRADGVEIAATQARETHLGREWQRWSRHLPAGMWKSGVDSLESYLALVRQELTKAAQ